jgi:uncharacterized Zn finger protein
MCKHVAAVFYGIGVRLDEQPELAFKMRAVDHAELIVNAAAGSSLSTKTPASARVLRGDDLSSLFGLDMEGTQPEPKTTASAKASLRPSRKKALAPDRSPAKPSGAHCTAAAAMPKIPKAKRLSTDVGKHRAL